MLFSMCHFLKNLFPHADDISSILSAHLLILDVRTPGEYSNGHIDGSLNISLDSLPRSLAQLPDKSKPIIVCCASGTRSSTAKMMLEVAGYTHVFNGGGWKKLLKKLRAA